jgi:hypothetical protein
VGTVASTAAAATALVMGTVVPAVMETKSAPSKPAQPWSTSASWAQLGETVTVTADGSGWEATTSYQCSGAPADQRQEWVWLKAELWQTTAAGGQQHQVAWAPIEGSECGLGARSRRLVFRVTPTSVEAPSALREGQAWYRLTIRDYTSVSRQPIKVVQGA